ncbi:TonB-dependent siderophore receptor [Pacificimonas flava]|uniref:TonB-dependent siderophore receptor n=2 Tax=Pacificimonas TaxID=1960290 RepID=A0A219B0J1_9SPHN|nr:MULTISPECIES: TonB-dependent siderophore receptor [Pacificimonas]MBZ6379652.1 TonB-dependent siderophore receptor [Pacificimonas aurantium]OWV31882.1 TonB-dependent siderophore receptor [Pacificimonas flava]
MSSSIRHAKFLALGCVGFVATAPALAQETPEEETQLEGVAVTYESVDDDYSVPDIRSPKSTAPLIDTPRIVTVIPEEVLKDTASFSLQEALRTVPGITLGAGEGGVASADIPFIRGVDATGDVFVDGVRDIGSQTREVFALEAIEVAKGPSSAFGGRGTAAGAINLVSKVARAGDFAEVQATAGTEDFYRVTADVNQELGDSFAVRLVGMYQDAMIPGRDEVYDDRWGITPSVSFGVGEDVTATLDYYHLETDAMPDYGLPLTSRNQLPGGVREPADVDPDNFYGLLARDFQETRVDAVTFQIDAQVSDNVVLSHITRYSNSRNNYIVTNPDDSAGNVQNGYVWRNTKSRNSLNEGIASNSNLSAVFETGGIEHSLSTGFEFTLSDSTNRNYSVETGSYRFNADDPDSGCNAQGLAEGNCAPLANPDPSDPWTGSITRSSSPSSASAEDYSVYLFDTVTLTESLLLNGGIRWTKFNAEGSGCGRGGCYNAENEADFVTWQAGAIFKPTGTTSLYASYGNSKTPPGTTVGEGSDNLGSNNQLNEPQEYENYEIGAKAELFEGGLLLSGALFRVDRNNILQVDSDADVVTDIFDSARLQGVEVSVSGTAGPVSLVVGYTYVDSELTDGSANDGNRLPQTPEHNLAATLDWEVTPRFSIGGGAYGASEKFADGGNLVRADGYVRFDAHAAYEVSDYLGIRVNVQNISDERYIVKLRNPHFAVPAQGRQALVTLTGRF